MRIDANLALGNRNVTRSWREQILFYIFDSENYQLIIQNDESQLHCTLLYLHGDCTVTF